MGKQVSPHAGESDISGTAPNCRECGGDVDFEDSFCHSCGTSLLETKPHLCGNCGRALGHESSFCPICGTKVERPPVDAPTGPLASVVTRPLAPAEPVRGIPAQLRRSRTLAIGIALALLIAGAGIGWYFLRSPDLNAYDSAIRSSAAAAEDVQESLANLQEPADLASFATAIDSSREDLSQISNDVRGMEESEHRSVLVTLLDAQDGVLVEFSRLARLRSAAIDESEFSATSELVHDFESAYDDALALRAVEGISRDIALQHETLERTLYDLAADREEILAQRTQIKRQNRRRSEELAATEAFIGTLDGIISRYAASRTELSDWIEETNAGRTWAEAYQVLDQQQVRRVQLRDELAAVEAPANFSATKTELLAIMDAAIDAMGAASRGMAEFQFDWSYWDFRDTPGWQEFERVTNDITDRFATTLSAYEATKDQVLRKLRKRTPLPELPD